MKKILFVLMLLTLISCSGKKYEIYTREEKNEMAERYVAIKKDVISDSNHIDKIDSLLLELEKAYKDGDETAQKEYEEWKDLIRSNHFRWSTQKGQKYDPNYISDLDQKLNSQKGELITEDGKLKKSW